MTSLAPPEENSSQFEYFLPYKASNLYVKFFNPGKPLTSNRTCLLLVHWMDVRGHKGNIIYEKLGIFFSSQGFPVFLFDVLGSGNSKGTFEFPQQQKDQIKIVYDHITDKLQSEYISNRWEILPIVHSISAVAIMSAINEGLPIKRLIWLGGPPSHAKSIKRDIQSHGMLTWFMYRFMAKVDYISGFIGLPITRKLFGFRLRLKDMNRSFSKAHGAKLMLSHKEMDILAIFGTKDEYLKLSDIDEEFPPSKSEHITRIILEGANHSFIEHIDELIQIIQDFISKEA